MSDRYYDSEYDDNPRQRHNSLMPKVAIGAALGGLYLMRKHNKAMTKLAKKEYNAAEKASLMAQDAYSARKFADRFAGKTAKDAGWFRKKSRDFHNWNARSLQDAAERAQIAAEKASARHAAFAMNSNVVPRTALYMGAGAGTAAALASRSERKRLERQAKRREEEKYLPPPKDDED